MYNSPDQYICARLNTRPICFNQCKFYVSDILSHKLHVDVKLIINNSYSGGL